MSPWLRGTRRKSSKLSKKERSRRKKNRKELQRLKEIASGKRIKGRPKPPKNPQNQQGKKNFSDLHHVFPPSHPGHQIRKVRFLHERWHDLFMFSYAQGKLSTHVPEEAIYILENYWKTPEGTVRELSRKRKHAYKELFGNATIAEAIEIIRRDWSVPGWQLTIDWSKYQPPKDPDAEFYNRNQSPEQNDGPKPPENP